MTKYVYPAVFTQEADGSYSVEFRDLEGCYTCGDNLELAIEMAQDALSLTLYEYEADNRIIPEPSGRNDISLSENEFVNYIVGDTLEYRKKFSKRSVRKNVTLPEWLNEEAEKLNFNFSQILQEALESKLKKKFNPLPNPKLHVTISQKQRREE